jgi:thiol-disulfide isomerase/thioredoxin
LNQEDINNLNRHKTNNEIETIIKNLSTRKILGTEEFTAEFCHTCKEVTPVLLKLFQKLQREGILLKSFYEASIP